jgi:hypothetical protein
MMLSASQKPSLKIGVIMSVLLPKSIALVISFSIHTSLLKVI